MREIVFDTETTGLKPEDGERIIEIGAVELENRFPTGRTFHSLVNPEGRTVHPDALAVHGIGDEQLVDKPTFAQIAGDFLGFVGDAVLVAHNAGFDMGFINAELGRVGVDPVPAERVVDTLALARRKHPMGPNSLDALCSRYGVDNSRRTKHGALLDSELLAEVYIEMTGGRQARLVLDAEPENPERDVETGIMPLREERPRPLAARLTSEALAAHRAFIADLTKDPIWNDYTGGE